MDNNKNIVKYFNPDFGNSIRYWFSVDRDLASENLQKVPIVNVKMAKYAVPTVSYVTSNKKNDVKIVIKNYVGKVARTVIRSGTDENSVDVDMSAFLPGLYFVEVWQDEYKGYTTFNIPEMDKQKK